MNVLHVSPSFYPASHYGGPVQSGHGLCNALSLIPGIDLRVLTTDADGPERIPVSEQVKPMPAGYEVDYCRRWFGDDISPGLLLRLWPMIRWADVVHLSAVYSPPTIPTLFGCKLERKPVVWTLRGALQRWEGTTRGGLKAAWEKACDLLCDSDRVLLHVTSAGEGIESSLRIRNGRQVVIPNGVDIPEQQERRQSTTTDRLRLLYLGRLHPIKGIENLLQAMSRLDDCVTLSICGAGNPQYEKHLQARARELRIESRVAFQGKVVGAVKEREFNNADLCIVPSFKENFCMVVVEALARGVPVVASHRTPWKRLEEMGCGLSTDNDAQGLANAIRLAARMPLWEMGERGRAWMMKDFSWTAIATQMCAHYRSLLQQREVTARKGRPKAQLG